MTEDWLQLQRKYWDEWTSLSRKAMGIEPPKTDPWSNALDHWWQAVRPGVPDAGREFMERMMEQGKMFFRMGEAFTRELAGAAGEESAGLGGIGRALDEMQRAFTGGYEQSDEALHKMLAFWELPYDNWQRMMSSLSPIPGDLLRNMPHDQVKESLHRFLSAPGLGYMREEQSQYQDLVRRTLGYQKALQAYLGFFSGIGVTAVDRLRVTLEGLQKEDKAIDSARTLYDTWVGCCEAVYAEEVQTPEYARIHGELVNAQMALKQRMSIMVDEALGAMNMPTRAELRTLQDRLQETRREQKTLRHELDQLKRQMTAGTTAAAPAPRPAARTAPAPRKKAAVRKKTAARAASK